MLSHFRHGFIMSPLARAIKNGSGSGIYNGPAIDWTKVQCLLRGEGTQGSLTINDETQFGQFNPAYGACISTAIKKFGNSSISFPGYPNYIDSPWRSGYSFGTGDFTIQTWVYFTSLSGTGTTVAASSLIHAAGSNGDGGGGTRWQLYVNPNGSVSFVNGEGSTAPAFNVTTPAGGVTAGQWYHIAVSRVSGILYIFINGIMQSVPYVLGNSAAGNINSNGPLRLGRALTTDPYSWCLSGYLDDVCIIKGVGLYTQNFVPPAGPVPVPVTNDLHAANTGFLLHCEGADGSKTVVDECGNAISLFGNAKISTAQSRFGNSSLYFPGVSTSYVALPNVPAVQFGTDDFTIECWLCTDGALAGVETFFNMRSGTTFVFAIDSTGKLGLWNGSWVCYDSAVFPTNQWVHVALTRSGATQRLFRDGVLVSTAAASQGSYANNNAPAMVGASGGQGSTQAYKGWMDEIRITKGFARYTNNFAVPTAPFSLS